MLRQEDTFGTPGKTASAPTSAPDSEAGPSGTPLARNRSPVPVTGLPRRLMDQHGRLRRKLALVRIVRPSCVRALVAISLALTACSVLIQWAKYWLHRDRLFGLSTLFDINLELSVPTWFQATQLLLSAVLLGAIAVAQRSRARADWKRWAVLALLFLYASLDDVTGLHDRLLRVPRALIANEVIWRYSWMMTGMVVLLVVALFFLPFIRQWPQKTRRLFLAGAAIYFTGAAGFEMLGGLYVLGHGYDNLPYNYLATVEELLEMLGQVTFIAAWLQHLSGMGVVAFSVSDSGRRPQALSP